MRSGGNSLRRVAQPEEIAEAILFLASEPLSDAITMAQGNRYTFRVRPSTYMLTRMLVDAVRAAHRASARVASLCTGVFELAAPDLR